ncbi:hypothetical protein NLG97_g7153 [Lecanicillium saksenae]|uniref:Uncharacterized protein n=1 Tax=Lecanicillium saksenae TaxID=468837 RepID=A0ACC1QP77_9HYPO|nr:hypothetical protein NLG97_g7153 [Lecanicillium saksenae]
MAGAGVNDHMVVTPDDHRAYIVIAGIVGLTWSVMVLCIRLFIRFRLTGPFCLDDWAATIATFFGACQTAIVFYAVRQGVGVRYNTAYDDSIDSAFKAYYASTIIRQAADKHLLGTRIVTAIIFIWGFASVLIVAFQCDASRPWDLSQKCSGLLPRWLVIETFSLVIELLISGLAFSLVLGLDMAFQTTFIVVMAFSAQLLVAIPVGYRLALLRDAIHSSRPVMFTLTDLTIVTQVVMHFSIMAATFPCFRQFLQAFNNDFGATTKMGTGENTRDASQGNNSNNSYAMSILRSRGERGAEGSALTTQHPDHDSDTDVEAVFRPILPSRDGMLAPADDGRSLQSMGSDRAMIKQKRA